jgi:hypothetical protein
MTAFIFAMPSKKIRADLPRLIPFAANSAAMIQAFARILPDPRHSSFRQQAGPMGDE